MGKTRLYRGEAEFRKERSVENFKNQGSFHGSPQTCGQCYAAQMTQKSLSDLKS